MKIDDASEQKFLEVYLLITGIKSVAKVSMQMKRSNIEGPGHTPLEEIKNGDLILERFSFECRKVIGFAITTLRDWFKKLAPLFHPIRSKTKTNRDSLVRVFPHFASATCNYFVFWLVHLIICTLCDWLEWLLWFWFYDTQLKTALLLEIWFI